MDHPEWRVMDHPEWAGHGSPRVGGSWITQSGRVMDHPEWAGHGSPRVGGSWITQSGRVMDHPEWAGHGSPRVGGSWITQSGRVMDHPEWAGTLRNSKNAPYVAVLITPQRSSIRHTLEKVSDQTESAINRLTVFLLFSILKSKAADCKGDVCVSVTEEETEKSLKLQCEVSSSESDVSVRWRFRGRVVDKDDSELEPSSLRKKAVLRVSKDQILYKVKHLLKCEVMKGDETTTEFLLSKDADDWSQGREAQRKLTRVDTVVYENVGEGSVAVRATAPPAVLLLLLFRHEELKSLCLCELQSNVTIERKNSHRTFRTSNLTTTCLC
ncbi:hypothetical protein WMY93_033789 [Mugilogobius chulae]|uniref:Ig-like domain-containing protein n=1 Tax=Mugilogobius chulae TaxID=88201 RepID=A0AAW0MJ75_9GOBI